MEEKKPAKKYITEFKELSESEEEVKKEVSVKKEDSSNLMVKNIFNKEDKSKKKEEQEKTPANPIFARLKGNGKAGDEKPYSAKDIILSLINVISIVFLFVILSKLESSAKELNTTRNEILQRSESPKIASTQLDSYSQKYEKLDSLFLNEAGVAKFVSDVETLKGTEGSFQKLIFSSQVAIKDKTGNFGYPVILTFKGSWEKISNDLDKINAMPYLMRVVKFKSEYNEEDNLIDLDYGLMLYVKERELKNK